jgi:hypothetical protein
MAKTNISFNNNNYSIDESSLSSATAALKSHLSTVMNGTGATITLDGTSYGVDATKLSTATNDFISHLGTISGSGSKVVVNGVEYGVDSNKVAGAIASLDTALDGLENGGDSESGNIVAFDGDWTGKEYFYAGNDRYFVKITDKLLTVDDLVGATCIVCSGDSEVSLTISETDIMQEDPFICVHELWLVLIVNEDNTNSYNFPTKKGTYFFVNAADYGDYIDMMGYTKSISCLTE